MKPEDDTRTFWIFTCANQHVVGILTQVDYDREGAFWELYGSIQKAAAAMDRGVEAELIDAERFHGRKISERHMKGCSCPR